MCHYNELDETAKHSFPAFVGPGGRSTAVSSAAGSAFEGCDLVKFTDYYLVRTEDVR